MLSKKSRVNLWSKRPMIKSIANLWKKRLPERNTVRGDANTKVTTIMDLREDIIVNVRGDANTKVTTIMDLPEDIIVNILLRLPVESLCRLQCVSKNSFDIARSPSFFDTLHSLCLLDPASNSNIFKAPQLILLKTSIDKNYAISVALMQSLEYRLCSSGEYKLTETKQSRLVSKIRLRISYAYDLVGFVYFNLLCFRRNCGVPWLLVNPLRGELLKLPVSDMTNITLRYPCDYWSGMGFDHTTSTYKIVHVLASEDRKYVMAQVLVLGTSSWRNIQLVSPCHEAIVFLGRRSSKNTVHYNLLRKNTVCTRGYVHRLFYGDNGLFHIISFDFNKEEFHKIPCPQPSGSGSEFRAGVFPICLRGSLAIVDIWYRSAYIKIWVLESCDSKKWELRHKIKIHELKLDTVHIINCEFAETCVEWEHGICLACPKVCYFLDLRHPSIRVVELPTFSPTKTPTSIFSHDYWSRPKHKRDKTDTISGIFGYTGGLISLKDYGSVIEATKSREGVWHID